MKEIVIQTLWALIQASISAGISQGKPGVEAALQVPLQVSRENEYVVFWEGSTPLVTGDGLRISTIDLRSYKTTQRPPFLVYSGLSGRCVTRTQIGRQYGTLIPYGPPHSHAPEAPQSWKASIQGVDVYFGFRNYNADCLDSVAIHMDKKS